MMPAGDYGNFANAMEDKINMDDIKDRDDLTRRLEKAFKGKKDHYGRQTREPTENQIDALSRFYGIFDEREPYIPEEEIPEAPKYPTHKVRERKYRVEIRTLTTIKRPQPTLYTTVSIIPRGYSKRQIRDVKTGRILRWE